MQPVKRIVKRVATALGILALFVIALLFVGIRWGFTPLPKPPQGVRIEPLSPSITAEQLTPDNGAFHYMKAVALIHDRQWAKGSKEQIEGVTVGVISGDTNVIEQTLKEIQPALELVRNGSQASSCQMPRLDLMTDTTTLSALRQLARLVIADGKWAEHEGDLTRASDDYLTAVKFGTDCAKGGPIIYALVGDAIVSMGTQALRAWTLQNTSSTNDLRPTMERLDRIRNQKTPFAETLRYELKSSKEQLHSSAFAEPKPWQRPFSESVTFRCFDAAYGDLIEDVEKPFWETRSEVIEKKWSIEHRHVWLWCFNRPVARILIDMLLPAIIPTRVKAVRADVELQATEVVCALKSYEFAHGAPPETLSDLVPGLLPSVPIDPFDGKPLRYRREGKEWVLWSVGSDMKDDNAAWHEFKYRTPNDNRIGGDIYFKSTEPQDDLAWELAHTSRASSVKTSTQ
jgi:hypothetical protein